MNIINLIGEGTDDVKYVEIPLDTEKFLNKTDDSNRIDSNSPEYIEVSTESEFREAVETDNGKTYIMMTDNIELLSGQVIVSNSKKEITIDGNGHMLESGWPVVFGDDILFPPGLVPPQVTDPSKQKMLYVNNSVTKEVFLANMTAHTRFGDGVVTIADSCQDVTVRLDYVSVYGPTGVINRNGIVNFTRQVSALLTASWNSLSVVPTKGLAVSNIVNISGNLVARDQFADNEGRHWSTLFRMNTSNGFAPHVTVMPDAKITSGRGDLWDELQSFIWSDSGETVLSLQKNSEIDIDILDAFNNVWGLSNVIIEEEASLKIKRNPGKNSPNALPYSTITATKGFTAKKDSIVEIYNNPTSKITGHVIEVRSGGIVDIINPKIFDIACVQGVKLFGSSTGTNFLNLSSINLLSGWVDISNDNPTYSVEGPLQAQWSWYNNIANVLYSSVDNLGVLYPIGELQRLKSE